MALDFKVHLAILGSFQPTISEKALQGPVFLSATGSPFLRRPSERSGDTGGLSTPPAGAIPSRHESAQEKTECTQNDGRTPRFANISSRNDGGFLRQEHVHGDDLVNSVSHGGG